MLENRNCMGHDVNDDTREGDSDVGTGNTGAGAALSIMGVIVERGCDGVGLPGRIGWCQPTASAMIFAMAAGSINGVKWFQSSCWR